MRDVKQIIGSTITRRSPAGPLHISQPRPTMVLIELLQLKQTTLEHTSYLYELKLETADKKGKILDSMQFPYSRAVRISGILMIQKT